MLAPLPASTGALNGSDTLTITAASDVLNFAGFLSGGAVDRNGGVDPAIVAYTSASNGNANIAGKVALYSDASFNGAETPALIATLLGSNDVKVTTAGGKAILITGDASGANDVAQIWFINDALDGTNGTISASDIVLVGTTSAAFDLDTLTTADFAFS